MNCCVNCFNDDWLKNYINSVGEISTCNYCNTNDVKCIEESRLYSFLNHLFSRYYEVTSLDMYNTIPTTFVNLIQRDWNIFNSENLDNNKIANLICNIFPGKPDPSIFLKTKWAKWDYYFKQEDWENFCNILKHQYRFFHDDYNIDKFDFKAKFEKIKEDEYADYTIEKSSIILYRGRNGYTFNKKDNKISPMPKKAMGIPENIVISNNGRANPQGINYLYTADDIPTVLAEIRAWQGEIISVASIEIKKDIKILDLTDIIKYTQPYWKEDPNDIEAVEILNAFSEELSRPINPKNAAVEYIPTQYICELVKYYEYDGIRFKSSLGQGNNLVLFNDKKIKILDVKLIQAINLTKYDYLYYSPKS